MNTVKVIEGDSFSINIDMTGGKPGEIYEIDVQIKSPDGTLNTHHRRVKIFPKLEG